MFFIVWPRKLDCYNPGETYENNRNRPDSLLSGVHFALISSPLQVLSNLFPVCPGSGGKIWFSKRILSGREENTEMSSLP
jgi:hypothetical protein